MREQQQELNRAQELKKAAIGNGVMLAVLVLGIILAVFAWFNTLRTDANIGTVDLMANDNLNISFTTYLGTENNAGEIIYDTREGFNLNGENYDASLDNIRMLPGEKKYFMTEISNYELSAFTGDFALLNIVVSKNLLTVDEQARISFAADLGSSESQQFYDLASYSLAYDTDYSRIPTQTIYKGAVLPAGVRNSETDNVEPGKLTVYWYVILDGEAVGNEAMGSNMMYFNNIKFFANGS